ncbi:MULTISPECIES: endonuclease V [Pseudofrankia]|uniref:endonuclease V n=1 Tax=Pseudofrankia TaxID=2994363 RepID=UPI000234C57D|nr:MULTISPECIES: endonuclease V [Pseudofrankia]
MGQIEDAEALQVELRRLVQADAPGPDLVKSVAGLDVAYDTGSDLVASAVVLAAPGWEVVVVFVSAAVVGRAAFPYLPGRLSFREPPPLDAWKTVLPPLAALPDSPQETSP